MNPDILAILITVKGAQQAAAAVAGVEGSLKQTAEQTRLTIGMFKALAAETAVLVASFKAAAEDESMRLQLRAITHDGAIAQSQIEAIRAESERGLFDKEELFQARKIFDETGASIKDLLPLAEELALRSGKGLGSTAQVFASLQGGGIARLGAVLRSAGLTVDALRGAGLDVTRTFQVRSSPQETIRVLRELLSKDSLSDALGGSLSASTKGVLASLKDLFRSIGDSLLPIIKPVLSFIEGLLQRITKLNDITGGWLGRIVAAVAAMKTIAFVLPILQKLVDLEMLAAYWQGILVILNNPWGAIANAILIAVNAVKALASADKIAAAWAAILDAFDGNWTALAVGAAVAAGVGIGWHFLGPHEEEEKEAPAAERPVRRSDIENQMNRARARAFA